MVCATQEHTGKTSVSMALLAGLVRRCDGPSDALVRNTKVVYSRFACLVVV